MSAKTFDTDVLVVGGGGAGFRAAIGARQKGVRVTLLSKGPTARSGATPMAGADFTLNGSSMAEIEGLQGDPNDSPEKVFNDIVTQGWFLNNQKLVEQYIRVAPQCLRELIQWGINIKMSDQRMIFTSGIGIMDALLKKARSIGVDLLEDITLLELCTDDGTVTGGLGLDVRSGEFVRFHAKAVIIATGGWHKAFWPNTGMRDLSGDGIAIAHRVGADLGNMEFVTFCCNVFLDPPMWRGSIAPYILSLFLGGRLTNSDGEEFLNKYDPFVVQKGTFTEWNKSFISHATEKEVRAGKGLAHGGVHYGKGDVPWEKIEDVVSLIFPHWKYKAIDLSEWGRKLHEDEPVEVGAAAEYFDGGIVVNDRFESSVPGLYAAGECTLGAFGANRVFSAITEMLVHGTDAGANAGEYAKRAHVPKTKADVFAGLQEGAEEPLRTSEGLKPAQIRRRVQEAAHRHLGPIRNKEELESFLQFLDSVREDEIPRLKCSSKSRKYNKEWIDVIETKNMVQLLEMAAQCALARRESRGLHFREDYPYTDNDNWLRESIVKRTSGGFTVSKRPVTVTAMSLPKGSSPYLEFMKKLMESHSDTLGKH
jgi:succinate dehydrogenase/fumarate reductase flavoprotein subunit